MKQKIPLIVLTLVVLFLIGKNISSSLFFQRKDRINVVFYGQNTRVYSLDVTSNIDYVLPVYPDFYIEIPGGYKNYRVGALGKLVELEKNPEMIKRAFSYNMGAMIDFYFYERNNRIYYGEEISTAIPSFSDVFLTRSNARFFDRVFLFLSLLRKNKRTMVEIPFTIFKKQDRNPVFAREAFYKIYQGYFYQKQYRGRKLNAQILYSKSYKAASAISNIVDGQGIRVVDVSFQNTAENPERSCLVIENSASFSRAAQEVASFFGCALKKGTPEISDMIIILGKKEEEWEVE